MRDIFGQAWSAAQETIGHEQWERLPDAVRVHAVYEQICRMDTEQIKGLPMFEESVPSAGL